MTVTLNFIRLAQSYVASSNSHNLIAIENQFTDTAKYNSANVGSYETPANIIAMMAGFFDSFPNVNWVVEEYVLSDVRSVSFEFVMTATNAKTGERIIRKGLERIDFDEDGKIILIDVGPGNQVN